jgi:TetR/AcrR family transcriptional regulator, mexJK operon transcriptional repressor
MTKAPLAGDKRKAKHAAILEAATDMFIKHGFDGASIDMIAEAAEVSRQTIYNKFENKQALFLEIAREIVKLVMDPLGDELEKQADMRPALTALARRMLEMYFCPKVSALWRMVIIERPRFPELGRALYEIGPAKAEIQLAAYLSEQTQHGRLCIEDSILAAQQFGALVLHQWQLKDDLGIEISFAEEDIARTAEEAVATFLRAFGASPSASCF